MNEQYAKYLGTIINLGILALVFFVPILFIPLPHNINDAIIFSEFNKQVVLIFGSLALFTLWCLKMILERRVTIVRSPIDIPLILFFLVNLLATIFSSDLFVSIAGYYGLFYPSLLGLLAFIVFYFTAVSNLEGKTKFYAAASFVASMVLVSILHLFNFLGYFIL